MSNTRKRSFTASSASPSVNPLEGVTFDVDGEEFACEGRMSYLETSDMARRISDLPTTDLDDLRAVDPAQAASVIGAMSQTLLLALGEAEYARFRKFCRDHATPDELVVQVLQFINGAVQDAVEEETGRPTGSSPRSPNGRAETAALTSPPGSPPDGEPSTPPAKDPAPAQIKRLGGKGGRRTA